MKYIPIHYSYISPVGKGRLRIMSQSGQLSDCDSVNARAFFSPPSSGSVVILTRHQFSIFVLIKHSQTCAIRLRSASEHFHFRPLTAVFL